MTTSTRNPFTTIRTEGALLPVDLLQRIVAGDTVLGGLDPESYHLPGSEKLNEAINRSWNRLLGAWATFQTSRGRLSEGDAGTTLTRERWLMPLFQELGYGRLQAAKPVMLEGKEYRVSHAWGEVPIHLVGCGVNLERRQAGVTGAAKSSPHSLVQEYLNRNPNQLWGLLSNGLTLRVLRDNASLTRQAYLEIDLEAMLTGEVYADFVVLWLVCHQSRVETQEGKPETCWLETWSKAAQEQGTRALDKLRDGVEQAITALGGGFLSHAGNTALKARLRSGALTREGYYRQLLRLVYRLIFLFAAEDRDLLLDPQASPAVRERYRKYYSATHLRQLAEQSRGGRHPDLYTTLRLVSAMLGGREPGGTGLKGLGLPVLGSFLFSTEALPDLETAELENGALLSAVRGLAYILDGNTRRSVDYRNLGTRELGSVYESLLELHPQINVDAGTFQLSSVAGNERKTTGSYYTPEDLIKVLLDSALDPVILQAIMRAGSSVEAQIAALLVLKVCDPACGSGHFLIAAARRIARRLAQLRSGDEEPSPEMTRTALREVIQHCVYGVDINPMSVELCKVNLWLESIEPGKPLSFLEAHIQCGDSLVGVAPGLDIKEIPDEAFNPCYGDDKATCTTLKKRNKRERGGQFGLFGQMRAESNEEDAAQWLAERATHVDSMPEDTPDQVLAKEKAFRELQQASTLHQKQFECNLWTAAFFWPIPKGDAETMIAPTQQALVSVRTGEPLKPVLQEKIQELSNGLYFFHWELRFPNVFIGEQSGFDCILGNPPWERIKLQEEEFFAQRDPIIATAQNKAARQRLIDALSHSNPTLALAFKDAKHASEATSKFVRESRRFPFTGVGDVNTYALFTEHSKHLISKVGRVGIIVPTGIATDDTLKEFFQNITATNSLLSLIGFENEEFLFSGIANVVRFCNLTLQAEAKESKPVSYAYYLRRVNQVNQKDRFFSLTKADLELLNPNTLTCPVFRNRFDADLTKKIYSRFPVLLNEKSAENHWGIRYLRMIDMASDSGLFVDSLEEGMVPLYEAKFFWHFDHRFGSYNIEGPGRGGRGLAEMPLTNYLDPNFSIIPRYWVPKSEVEKRLSQWQYGWLIGFRDVTSAKLERTAVFSLLPRVAIGHKGPLVFLDKSPTVSHSACFLTNVNSLVFDYIARQKIGGTSMSYFIMNQLPVLPPNAYTASEIHYLGPRMLELVYTSWDIKAFADDLWQDGDKTLCELIQQQWEENRINTGGHEWNPPSWAKTTKDGIPLPPFRWNENRRVMLRAELDAYFARLYGLNKGELHYILDPQDMHGLDFPGETFRVLKEKEMRLYGEYRTRRLVLEAWDRLEGVTPAPVSAPVEVSTAPKTESKAVQVKPVVEEVKEKPAPESQPMLSDFGLYKCGVCGKMVMGFEKESHEREKHGGKSVEWKKVR